VSSQPQIPTEAPTGRVVVPAISYLMCATPRCGSTLLCDGLEATGLAGRPREYFEELKETGVPRRPREYFWGLRSPDVLRLLPQPKRFRLQINAGWSPKRIRSRS